jgi:competence protein ComEA
MHKLLQSLLLGLGMTLLAGGALAKDEPKKPAASAAAEAPAASAPKTELLDINSASKKELAALPKIGDVRAAAIIKGRPYKGKDDLVNKKVLSEDVYNEIKDSIIAKQKPAAAKKK